jgi:protocatechuate 3,4-dioxygenase beta subunit
MAAVLTATGLTAAPVAQDAPGPRATARVFGIVVASDTGRPIDGAVVELSHDSPGKNAALTANTGPDGVFVFSDLVPGTFILSAGGPRYNRVTYRRSQSPDAPERHTLAEGQQIAATLAIVRLGSFSGRVLDPFGDPLAGIGVFALQKQMIAGLPRLVRAGRPIQPLLTDDLGRFRLSGFRPGEYYLVALSGALTASPLFNNPNETSGFLPTYYPGTPSVSDAQPLELGASHDVTGITITAIPTAMYRVTGTVVDSKGEPLASALVTISPADGPGLGVALAGRAQARADGAFSLSNVPPGPYVVQGRSLGTTNAFTGEFGWADVTVAQSDVMDVRVTTSGPSSLKGRVRLEPPPLFGNMIMGGFKVEVPPVDFNTQPVLAISTGWQSLRLSADGTFEVGGLWGRRLVRVHAAIGVLERILLDGRDITDTPIEFNGRDRTGVEVVLTRRTGTLAGRALDGDSTPASGCQIVVFAADSDRWIPHSRFVSTTTASSDGSFRVESLLPGSYLVVAVPADIPNVQAASFLQQVRGSASAFIASEGITELELSLLPIASR